MTNTRQRDVTTPHFSIPFRFGGVNGGAFVNEQDSYEDYIDCIKTILAFPIGSREDLPGFGRPEILFREITTGFIDELLSAVSDWEPRVVIDGELRKTFDELVHQLILKVRSEEV